MKVAKLFIAVLTVMSFQKSFAEAPGQDKSLNPFHKPCPYAKATAVGMFDNSLPKTVGTGIHSQVDSRQGSK